MNKFKNPTIQEVLTDYPQQLRNVFGDKRRDIEDILCHILKKDRAFLFAHPEKRLTSPQFARLKLMFEKRKKEIPLQYIFGKTKFHGFTFKVNRFVLIPRPETELLVDVAKEYIQKNPIRNIVDIGTGSGAIIITLAKLLKDTKKDYNFIGTDKSAKALQLARLNGMRHRVLINFRNRDFIKKPNTFLPLTSWALISNPPYVKTEDLDEPSIQHEPALALDGGSDGLDAYRTLLEQVSYLQNLPKAIFLEIGHDQAADVKSLAEKSLSIKSFEIFKDACDRDRVVKIELE